MAGSKYQLAKDVRFHLYVSAPPCGDSKAVVPKELDALKEGSENPSLKKTGLLRVKIEDGIGGLLCLSVSWCVLVCLSVSLCVLVCLSVSLCVLACL